ncbi:hypothetical protein GW765_03305 [Candidatus Parcubacteria bacterium]|nr:hypothetical protein [Candidatus Parcubacteria bacterium]
MEIKFKTKSELRIEYDQQMKKLGGEKASQIKAMQEKTFSDAFKEIQRQRSLGFTKEADAAQNRLFIVQGDLETRMTEVYEEGFQKHLAEYEKFKKSILFIDEAVTSSVKRAEEELEATMKRLDGLEERLGLEIEVSSLLEKGDLFLAVAALVDNKRLIIGKKFEQSDDNFSPLNGRGKIGELDISGSILNVIFTDSDNLINSFYEIDHTDIIFKDGILTLTRKFEGVTSGNILKIYM